MVELNLAIQSEYCTKGDKMKDKAPIILAQNLTFFLKDKSLKALLQKDM